MKDTLKIGDKLLQSRLLVGTGKFSSNQIMKESIIASESEVITMALRRINLENDQDSFLEVINSLNVLFLPNTSGARDHIEAIRIAKLARKLSNNNWIKLEVTPDPKYLLPDPIETYLAAKILVQEGFNVLPYINCDPILAKKLEEIGCLTVMPMGSPIGSNFGLRSIEQLRIIIEQSYVPVIIDAGIGSPSHAAKALEMGVDAVMINTAIAISKKPVMMAEAFKLAVKSGRKKLF